MHTSTVVSVTVGTVVAGALGYAVYFDYKRRNDPAFRNKLRKEAKRTEKAKQRQAQEKQRAEEQMISDIVAETNKPGKMPTSPAEMEQMYKQSLGIGEILMGQGPEHYLTAAHAFYQGIKACPVPVQLLHALRESVPKEVLDLIMRMVAKDEALSGETQQEDPLEALFKRAAAGAPRAGGASLEELDDDDGADKPVGAGAAASPTSSPDNGGNNAPSVSSQEWETVSAPPQGDHMPTGSYAAAAAMPVTMPHERQEADGTASTEPSVTASQQQATSSSSAPEGSYAAAAEQHVDIPLGQGQSEKPVPQPTTEHA